MHSDPGEDFCRSVFEHSMDAVLFTAPDGRIFSANPAACRLFQRTVEGICRAGRAGLVDPASPQLADMLQERERTGRTQGELIFIRGDGSRFVGGINSAVFTGPAGEARTVMIIRDLTRLKQAEAAQQRLFAQATYEAAEVEAILAAQDDVILLYDLDMNVRRATPSFRRDYGFDPTGCNLREIVARVHCRYPDGTPLVLSEQPTPRALRGEEVHYIPYAVTRVDGSTAIVETSSRPLRLGERIAGTVTVWHDVTEVKAAEAALRQALRETEDLYDRAPCGYHSLDKDGVIVQINETELAWLGYTREELVGKRRFRELVTPESQQVFAAHFPVFLRQGHIEDLEFEMVRRDGTVLSALVSATAIYDAAGNFLMSRSTVFDITERKRAEVSVRLAASVFTHAREGIIITDARGTIIEVNDTVLQLTGYARHELVGNNPRLLQSGRHDADFYRDMWQLLQQEGHWRGEVWNRRKDGDLYAELLTISAVRGPDGKVVNYVGLFTDITPLKQHEQELEQLANYDTLTGLLNRTLLADRLQQAMVHCRRSGQTVAVAYVDLDGFKAVNDRYGHHTGDRLLIAVAQRMKEALREGDSLARVGGDEFVAILADLDRPDDYRPVVNRLLQAASREVEVDGRVLQVSASIGVALYPQDEGDADHLMRHADHAMYAAKQAGRNCYRVFAADTGEPARTRE